MKNLNPDIMLLDIRMPGMDGIEVFKCVRQFDKEIDIIMVTAVKDEEIGKEALKSGADDYVTKPIDLNYLETTVLFDLTMRKCST